MNPIPMASPSNPTDNRPYISILASGQHITSTFAASACVAVITSGSGRVRNTLGHDDPALDAEAAKRGFVKMSGGWWWYSPEQASNHYSQLYLACLDLGAIYEAFKSRRRGSIADLKHAVEKVLSAANIFTTK
jgi:hypothetical protein